MSTNKTVRLKAIVRQIKGGRLLLPGDEFDESEDLALNLIRMHYAAAVISDAPKRAYRRRDMKAED